MKFPFFSREPNMVEERKKSVAHALHMTNLPGPAWSMGSTKAYAKEGYQINVIASQAINRIADAVASTDWEVWTGNKKLEAHPMLDLIKRPNPMQSGSEWWRAKTAFLYIYGNAYGERVMGTNGKTKELWCLRPDRVTITPSNTGMPASYVYTVGGRKHIFPSDPLSGDSDIQHIKLFNPLDDWYGQSPMEAAAYAIDQHNAAMCWLQSLLENSARPSGALETTSESTLSDEEVVRLKAEIREFYSGQRNAGRPMLLAGGLSWKAMGMTPQEMEAMNIKNSAARDICIGFGVPPLLLNIPGDSTYTNYKEARLAFYEDTVIPVVSYMADEMNAWLSGDFGGVSLRPNFDAVEAIAEKRMSLWAMADASDDLTLNEVRELKGYPPLPNPLGSTIMAEVRMSQRNKQQISGDPFKSLNLREPAKNDY